MLMWKRYQALRAIHIRVPGEPGNKANITSLFEAITVWKTATETQDIVHVTAGTLGLGRII